MLRIEKENIPPKGLRIGQTVFTVYYKTPKREGFQRFDGWDARERCDRFASKILAELA